MVQAIVRELQLRKEYFATQTIETIYFGGGTPSLLSFEELELIFKSIFENYQIDEKSEITMECNPEDLSNEKLHELRKLGINRLSIGIQTFNNDILAFMNRAHDSEQAKNAVILAKANGFDNITIDLMYALPNSTSKTLQYDLDIATSLDVPHISAYCFTLEEKTVFGKWEKQNKLLKNNDLYEQEQYLQLSNHLAKNGYEQYEISNYARNKRYSKHNSAYWFGTHYLGIGPGAHSFNGTERQWNISNNSKYLDLLNKNELAFESEVLSVSEQINEAILIQLRTKWGLNLEELKNKFQFDLFKDKTHKINQLINSQLLKLEDEKLFLTEKGKLLADGIVVNLMI